MSDISDKSSSGRRPGRVTQVIVVSSVMFTFISYWRTAAIVLSDLGSTAYYIGGIVEQAIGPAAPWFILSVMLFSYAVRSVYIESVSLFVRGGVYRVTREALGGLAAKVAVSALLFDYVLTGPISSVSAGQYIMGLLSELSGGQFPPWVRSLGAVVYLRSRVHSLKRSQSPPQDGFFPDQPDRAVPVMKPRLDGTGSQGDAAFDTAPERRNHFE